MKLRAFSGIGMMTAALALSQSSYAQDVLNLGKYGQYNSFGTARSMGFGNTLGSVGGDFSSLSVNPAGIGIYRSSEVMFTPGLRFSSNNSIWQGKSSDDNNVRFGFNNMGAVFTDAASSKNYDRADWKSTSFGFGLNRVADFNRTYNYNGTSYNGSASQYFEADALSHPDDVGPNQGAGTPAYLGYQSYLLSGNLLSLVPYTSGINQQRTVQEKGGITEMAISAGGNYRDKLLIGGTLGIDFLNHKSYSTMYEETINAATSDSFDHFSYNESVRTNGTGVNLKLGMIYKFNNYFRAGLAVHTPTLYTLKETSDNDISVTSNVFGTNGISSPQNQFEYTYVSPMKVIASATGILGKYGFLSMDYEYVTYNTMRYHFENFPTEQQQYNSYIKSLYTGASNLRAGLELRFDQFMVRGGYGFYGSPFKQKLYMSDRNDFSFGIGYRFEQSFIDFAITKSYYKTYEQPYVLANGYNQPQVAEIRNSPTYGVITVGWKL
ncbi:hypothetical protein [Rurimicrobium arvi]|uniref:Hemin receptor n=1 Tax=Rurimicrobium arvi TaxID=2049916 RepID=A0ABP8MT86_9BACT